MKIIDPLPPVILFLGIDAAVFATQMGVTSLEYVVLVALLLAVGFGSVLLGSKKTIRRKVTVDQARLTPMQQPSRLSSFLYRSSAEGPKIP